MSCPFRVKTSVRVRVRVRIRSIHTGGWRHDRRSQPRGVGRLRGDAAGGHDEGHGIIMVMVRAMV